MTYYLGVTNIQWYNFLRRKKPEDVNFWQPGGKLKFKVLKPGQPFLFKLKSPINAIGGLGFFSSHTFLPLNMAWAVFKESNGCDNISDFRRLILANRTDHTVTNPTIGCIVLTNPVFFEESDWVPVPDDWKPSIQQGKMYSMSSPEGKRLWNRIEAILDKYLFNNAESAKSQLLLEEPEAKYGNPILTRVRLGQNAFRVLVTDAYNRKCAISGEKTLPVLEAAHIKQYAESGPHFISNGLLLRSDLHKLFDTGYLTITNDLKVEVSQRIKEEFENGRAYYKFHGQELTNLPARKMDLPNRQYLEWHHEKVYRG
jgi:putative restriction endonuclease